MFKKQASNHISAEAAHEGLSSDHSEDSFLLSSFKSYAAILKANQDKYERLFKLGRDITIESKRIIFLLLSISGERKKETVLSEAKTRLDALVRKQFCEIARETAGGDSYQFHRAYSGANQEFVEALTLYEYIKDGCVLGPESCHKQMRFNDDGLQAFLPNMDYLLGLFDLTGELMRYSVAAVNQGNFKSVESICSFVRQFYANLISVRLTGRDFQLKKSVLFQSLLKIENILFNIRLRGSELPQHLLTSINDDVKVDHNRDEGVYI